MPPALIIGAIAAVCFVVAFLVSGEPRASSPAQIVTTSPPATGSAPSRLARAGIYASSASTIFLIAKIGLGLLLAAAAAAAPLNWQLLDPLGGRGLVGVGAIFGYLAPNAWLARRTRRFARELLEPLPDFLDLLTSCVEGGISTEAAFVRVVGELSPCAPALSRELQGGVVQLQGGLSLDVVLRLIGERTGGDELSALGSLFGESQTLGTSVGPALRQYASGMRERRAQRAEEQGQKAATKLMLPMLFCFLPATLALMLASPFLQILRTLRSLSW